LLKKIHIVFHISQLKEFKGHEVISMIPFPLLFDENGWQLQPMDDVLQTRTIVKGDYVTLMGQNQTKVNIHNSTLRTRLYLMGDAM